MPTVAVKLYSVFFKFLLKNRLQTRIQTPPNPSNLFGITTRPDESLSSPNPSFTDGVATKDIHIDSFTSLSVRIFLPDTALRDPEKKKGSGKRREKILSLSSLSQPPQRRNSYDPSSPDFPVKEDVRRKSVSGDSDNLNSGKICL